MKNKQNSNSQSKGKGKDQKASQRGSNSKTETQTLNTTNKISKITSKEKQKGKSSFGKRKSESSKGKPNEKSKDKEENPQPLKTEDNKKKQILISEDSKYQGRPPHISVKQMFSFNYIYRREQHSISKLNLNVTLQEIQQFLSKHIEAPINELVIMFNGKELHNFKEKVFELIKNNRLKYFEVKRKIKTEELANLPSLSSSSLNFKIYVSNPPSGIDLYNQVDIFFKKLILEKNAIVEPTKVNQYVVSFPSLDLAFDFKRFMNILKKENPLYFKVNIIMTTPELQTKVKTARSSSPLMFLNEGSKRHNNPLMNNKKDHISIYLNHGAYYTYDDLRKNEEQNNKKRWITTRGFLTMIKPENE